MTNDEVLAVSGLHKWYGDDHVLRGVDFTVNQGEVVSIIGPSGAGKSTMLRCINYLDTFDRGSVRIRGEEVAYIEHRGRHVERPEKDLAAMRSRMGMVFQNFNLFGHLTALENVMFAPRLIRGQSRSFTEERGHTLLGVVGMESRAHALPSELSGGEQQRVAIARALAMKPELLLLDEPTSALDPQRVGEVLGVVRELARAGTTMLVVTHEVSFAREVSDRIIFMLDGRVHEEGLAAQMMDSPRTPELSAFLGLPA